MNTILDFLFGEANVVALDADNTAGVSEILIKEIREDKPEFKREYSVKLDGRAALEVEIYSRSYGGRSIWGTLTQPNGKYVLFRPEEIADKIIDPMLVPLVQKYCDRILAADRHFRDSEPQTFVDKTGQKWARTQ